MKNDICPRCGVALGTVEEGNLVFMICRTCGFRKECNDWIEHECGKCGCMKATVVLDIMIKGDEGMTTMLRCIKCGAVEKEGYKGF
jgi:DNA-directed RNA polymerase subunit M/transcription elongation factor TFIIS